MKKGTIKVSVLYPDGEGKTFDMDDGEYIVTEHSHKYSLDQFELMAETAGFSVHKVWTDENDLFSVQYLKAA